MTIKPPPGTPGRAWPAIVVGLFVAFGGVLFGYDTGTIGGILGQSLHLNPALPNTGYKRRHDMCWAHADMKNSHEILARYIFHWIQERYGPIGCLGSYSVG